MIFELFWFLLNKIQRSEIMFSTYCNVLLTIRAASLLLKVRTWSPPPFHPSRILIYTLRSTFTSCCCWQRTELLRSRSLCPLVGQSACGVRSSPPLSCCMVADMGACRGVCVCMCVGVFPLNRFKQWLLSTRLLDSRLRTTYGYYENPLCLCFLVAANICPHIVLPYRNVCVCVRV